MVRSPNLPCVDFTIYSVSVSTLAKVARGNCAEAFLAYLCMPEILLAHLSTVALLRIGTITDSLYMEVFPHQCSHSMSLVSLLHRSDGSPSSSWLRMGYHPRASPLPLVNMGL